MLSASALICRRGGTMLSDKEYIQLSLETNLFFLRIVKEHAIFAAASLPPRDLNVVNQLISLKNSIETLLDRTVQLSNGIARPGVFLSDEIVTEFTLPAETAVQSLTGIPINTDITKRELDLEESTGSMPRVDLVSNVSALNREAIKGTTAAIEFKTALLTSVLNCRAFSYTYPLMLDHVIREAKFYVMLLTKLENRDMIDSTEEVIALEVNWNRIMGEHTSFIRGYLDPSEIQLFDKANDFFKEFTGLVTKTNALQQQPGNLPDVTKESEQLVTNLRDFKRQGTEGLLECEIKAIMPALLADHVTREANHYLRLLGIIQQNI